MMKKKKNIIVMTMLMICMFVLSACGGTVERWAYVHEPETAVLSFKSNGKAIYKDKEYQYTKDDSYIHLKGKGDIEDQDLRYIVDGDKMILYESSTYQRKDGSSEDGVFGVWVQDNGWEFQFTKDGKFSEENIFYGHYSLDKNNRTIKLMYDEPLEDAILYYELNGNELTIEYPWPMTKAVEEDSAKK
ncbi:MAG: hypothetical protein K6E98_10410 [Lachnospiraceae bacterium]|nr:hypothetical protein [Lachnospiraceae bacterium]